MCGYKVAIPLCKEEPNQVDINTAAVIGSVNIGAGFTQLQSFTSSLDIPPMSYKMFARAHETACNAWESLAWETMKEAAKEESLIAIQSGSVDEDGIPMITVVCDGSWAKRSYRGGGNYNSLSGTAAIIGFNTKKILYIGIKNKYCIICQRAENTRSIPKSHVCYKNWHGSSTAMESAIIADGFCKSVEMYNLIYSKMIADGDSSAYRKILDRKPYKNCVVEKIECRNHLLRNYCNKLKEFAKSRNLPTILRNIINENIIRARSAVVKAIKYRKEEKCTASEQIINLRKDILNSLSHILGEHKECQNLQYFCNKSSPDARNIIEDIEILGLSDKLNQIVRHLASHSKSLIMNVDTNTVEQFNSIIVKYTGGKRINLTMRRSYQGRCMAAVVSRNTKRPVYYTHKYLNEGASPGKNLVSVEAKKAERLLQATKRPRKKLNLKNCSVKYPG
ncbi:hypothetical protein RI129_003246 [Pyrocoelia pectoralis]|uniref:Mutator-like transposase domain-containing protein n=1 Tax=Pyrocoelia pectoralis TaxID=417401 RepID=A0AAN7VP05_9COLE